jgi:hypothetical protein
VQGGRLLIRWSLVRFQPGEPSRPNHGKQVVSPRSTHPLISSKNSYLFVQRVMAGNLTARRPRG